MSSPAQDSVALGRVLLTPPLTTVAMYVLTPHNYVALALAARFSELGAWRPRVGEGESAPFPELSPAAQPVESHFALSSTALSC